MRAHESLSAVASGEPKAATSPAESGNRAGRLGSRAGGGRRGAALAAVLLVALTGAGALLASEGVARHGSSQARYGGLPSWLPKPKHLTNQLLHADPAHHLLAIQGNQVSVTLPHGHVLATAVGPQVPEEGHFPVPPTSPATFIVTFTAGSGAIPLSPGEFGLIDDLGHVRHPTATAMDGGPLPQVVPPGQTLSIKLHDVIPTGDGGLAWTPYGERPIVTWDFIVEID